MTEARLVISTVASREAGLELARRLVGERLAACVNISPAVTSLYWWRGKLEESQECMLVIKTTGPKIGALRERLLQLHEYEVPEFLVLAVEGGTEAYLQWIAESVR